MNPVEIVKAAGVSLDNSDLYETSDAFYAVDIRPGIAKSWTRVDKKTHEVSFVLPPSVPRKEYATMIRVSKRSQNAYS